MINIYYKPIGRNKLREITEFRPGCWINVENTTREDLEKIVKLTGLELHDLQDSLDIYEVPRIERQEEAILIFTRHPDTNQEGLYTDVLTLIITKDYLITISPHSCHLMDRLKKPGVAMATTQKSRLLIRILLLISQDFTYQVKQVRQRVLTQKRNIKKDISAGDIVSLAENEEVLNQYLSALIPMQNVAQAIKSGHYVNIFAEDEDLVQDLLISFRQSADICTVNLKSIRNVRDSYQIIFTNNLNKIVKFFTSISIILTIPTIIASIYGMNVLLPLQDYPFAFFVILTVTVTVSVLLSVIFVWKRWV